MKKLFTISILTILFFVGCEKDNNDAEKIIKSGDYPVKEYFIERNPEANVWGAGIDFVHDECKLAETELDYQYLTEITTFPFDLKFYTVKAYYTNDAGETKSEGCPAILLGTDVTACKIGAGVAFFDSLEVLTEAMLSKLTSEPTIDYEACKIDGKYDRVALFASIDKCVIGRSFRGNVLTVPDGKTEQDVQPVFIIKTKEGGFAKFMVKQFQGDKPNEKQTLMRWQVISE